jgi:hypothetical protein
MNTPITEAHRKLATDLCRNVTGSNRALHHVSKFAQLIADSEATAIRKQIEALEIAMRRWLNMEKERDQLRAENSDLKATDTRPLLTGKLTHAGFCRINGEQVDGVFIAIDREQIRALPRFPMYERIELRVAALKEGAK